MDQTRHATKTMDHEYLDSEMIGLLSKVCSFCEERHAITDCPFMPFHIKVSIVKHLELYNMVGALIDQSQERE